MGTTEDMGEPEYPSAPIVTFLRSSEWLGTWPPRVHGFFEFLAKRIEGHPTIVAPGIVMVVTLAFHDAAAGVDGFTGERLRFFEGVPPFITQKLAERLPGILAKAVSEECLQRVTTLLRDLA